MRVVEYRDLIRALFQVVTDWHACTSDTERRAWVNRSARVHQELEEAACTRATPRDSEMRDLAQQQYRDLVARPLQQEPHGTALAVTTSSTSYRAQSAGTSRAARHNKSAGRAVRLSRAARGAMRRGYF